MPRPPIRHRTDWLCLTGGLFAVFAVFHGTASAWESHRGEAGLTICAVVIAAVLLVEYACFRQPPGTAVQALGLGWPHARGMIAAACLCLALLCVIPLFAWTGGARVSTYPGWPWLVPGLFAQAGIAEETLFRGYLFGRLRAGRTFRRAATLSMLPFVAVHLLMFATMPWPVAAAAVLLAVLLSFPLAWLFELGGRTIWPAALVHFVVQGAVKVVVVGDPSDARFPVAWMTAAALGSMLVFLVAPADTTRTPVLEPVS